MSFPATERRCSSRIRLQVPFFIRGVDDAGSEFMDLIKALNISATGALLVSTRTLRTNQLVWLTVPVSSDFFSALIPKETPPIQARVCRSGDAGDSHLLAVEFLKALD